MKRTLPPSAGDSGEVRPAARRRGRREHPRLSLSETSAKLGARLIIQRAVEDEFLDAWLGRARYERRPDYQRGLRNFDSGSGNGYRPRRVQTAEGVLPEVEIPQVREAAKLFVSPPSPDRPSCFAPGPWKRWSSAPSCVEPPMRDVESLCEEAGLGKLSKLDRVEDRKELRDRFEHFKRRDLYGVRLVVLFLDAIFLNVRPYKGPNEGVLCAWGFTEEGERVLVGICLGMRESHADWLCLARDLIARGLGAPMLVVADGAPGGLIKAVEQCFWPASGPSALLRPPSAQPDREAARARSPAACAAPTGRRSTRPRTSATQESRSQLPRRGKRKSRLCVRGEMPRRRPRGARRPPALPAAAPQATWRLTTLLERTLGQVKRRTKVIGRFPGEESIAWVSARGALSRIAAASSSSTPQASACAPSRSRTRRSEREWPTSAKAPPGWASPTVRPASQSAGTVPGASPSAATVPRRCRRDSSSAGWGR